MTDRDRLIEILQDTLHEWECDVSIKTLTEIAEHLLANGVIVPPCKVGDKIYMLVTRKTHCFVFEEEKKMLRVDNQHTFIKETYLTKLNFFKVIDDFDKTVFLTREEAEKALEKKK